ncbi:flagellar motor protein MotD [Marinobacter salinisoli]|uniref:Flagellar motor protein MotD n=1 Tax=Marinobacter salinisoli TaxID=2769486 RepID=A0ABX7MPZ9_9GAMM|nr:flagellar motor protein MotD [Marinobacter salinisoli]QSP94381.1 flagellar motor protein MotD [Marinobacter salinisoli]
MRRRRPTPEEPHNKERWLISYADFITLLFAFFVVMYSVSSVNEGKYKVLSETLTGVFNAPQRSIEPVPVGEQPRNTGDSVSDQAVRPVVAEPSAQPATDAEARTRALRAVADELAGAFDELIQQGVVTLETSERWLALNLPNSLLFGSGDAEPHYDAFDVIARVAGVLRDRDNAIKVEGFTDNQPIKTARFPSNWELSTARAAAVARMLVKEGVEPSRLVAAGYGQHQPVARNDTDKGRRKNRRVVLLISRDASVRGAMR